jgi:hypothetical protein
MDTIVIKDKRFVIKKGNDYCGKCLFNHNSNYPNSGYHCIMTKCHDFIVIREVNVIDRIRLWLKKKIKK